MVYHYQLRLVARLKSGGPSLGRSPGAHKQRRPVNQNQIQIFGEIGSTQLLEQGTSLALFFDARFRSACFREAGLSGCSAGSTADSIIAADMTARTHLIQRSF